MATEFLRVTWHVDKKESAEIDRLFSVTSKAAGRTKELFQRILPLIRSSVKTHFVRESGPMGRWPRLSSDYSAWKEIDFPGQPILQLRRYLIDAATQTGAWGNITKISKKYMEFGVDLTRIPYARIHDLGGKTRGRRIPKREYMFLSKKDQDDIAQLSARFIWDEGLAGRVGGGVQTPGTPWGLLSART